MKILTLENKCFLLNNLPEELTDDVRFAVLDNSNPKEPVFFFIPLIFLESWDKMTLPIGLQTLKGFISPGSNVSVIMAALSMIVMPTLVLFIFLQKYIIKGLTFSGIK